MHTVCVSALPPPPELQSQLTFQPVSDLPFATACIEDTLASAASFQLGMRDLFQGGITFGWRPVPEIKAVFFDMDATVIAQESIVELARFVGREKDVEIITQRAMEGELDFKAALNERVALLEGTSEAVFEEVLPRLTVNHGLTDFVSTCKKRGVPCFLVSGGFVQLAMPLGRRIGFRKVYANTLDVSGGRLTGRLCSDIVDAEAKKSFLLKTCRELGLSPSQACAVGDGANDLPMLSEAGLAVGFHPKSVLFERLHAANFSRDHRFLVPLLFTRCD